MHHTSDPPPGLAAYLTTLEATAGTPPDALLEVIADAFGGIAFALDAEGRLLASGGRVQQALETRRTANRHGRLAADIFHDVPEILSALRRALAGTPSAFDVTVDGRGYHCEYAPMLGGDGTVTRVVGFATPLDADEAGGGAM